MTLNHYWSSLRARVSPALLALLLFLAAVALTGGTSRADSLAQPLVRLSSAIFIAGWIAAGREWRGAALRPAFIFLGLLATLLCVQLVPLPPAVWSSLPGHQPYLASAQGAGIAQPWRPIALVPDRAWNSLFALLVPFAALIGLGHLSARRRASLVFALWVLALASAILGLAQMSDGTDSVLRPYIYSSDRYAVGFFANRNHQALLLAAALPMLAAWATVPGQQIDARRMRALIAAGIAAFIVLMLPTTGSRAGIVLALIGGMAAIGIAAVDARTALRTLSRRRRRMLLGYVAGGVAALAAVLIYYGRNEAIQRLYGMNVADDLRARALPTVLGMTREFFPVGIGFGSFDIVYRRFEPFELLSTNYLNQAHNDVLQLALEGGVAGIALLVGAMIWWGRASLRAWRSPQSAERQAALAGSAVLAMALVASAFDYPLRTPLMMVVVAVAWCWLASPLREWRTSERALR